MTSNAPGHHQIIRMVCKLHNFYVDRIQEKEEAFQWLSLGITMAKGLKQLDKKCVNQKLSLAPQQTFPLMKREFTAFGQNSNVMDIR